MQILWRHPSSLSAGWAGITLVCHAAQEHPENFAHLQSHCAIFTMWWLSPGSKTPKQQGANFTSVCYHLLLTDKKRNCRPVCSPIWLQLVEVEGRQSGGTARLFVWNSALSCSARRCLALQKAFLLLHILYMNSQMGKAQSHTPSAAEYIKKTTFEPPNLSPN